MKATFEALSVGAVLSEPSTGQGHLKRTNGWAGILWNIGGRHANVMATGVLQAVV